MQIKVSFHKMLNMYILLWIETVPHIDQQRAAQHCLSRENPTSAKSEN